MKKGLILMTLGMLCITGCGTKEEKTMTCTRTANQGNLKMDLTYTVTYQGETVNKVESVEKIISEDAGILDNYKSALEEAYAEYNKLDHYNVNITVNGNELNSKTTIDYSKVDTDKMIELDSANAQLIKDGKVSINDLQSAYESIGASCSK